LFARDRSSLQILQPPLQFLDLGSQGGRRVLLSAQLPLPQVERALKDEDGARFVGGDEKRRENGQ
jgi:hypothetical protein